MLENITGWPPGNCLAYSWFFLKFSVVVLQVSLWLSYTACSVSGVASLVLLWNFDQLFLVCWQEMCHTPVRHLPVCVRVPDWRWHRWSGGPMKEFWWTQSPELQRSFPATLWIHLTSLAWYCHVLSLFWFRSYFTDKNTSSLYYLADLMDVYELPRCLWSTNCHLLAVPSCVKSSFASRAFCVSSLNNWNSLPLHLRLSDSLVTFQSRLKSHLFSSAYHV